MSPFRGAAASAPVERDTFRDALCRWAAGVTIVTTVDRHDRRPWGFTASAFSSLSLDPPLILVCLDRDADCHDAFTRAKRFMINVLRAEHEELALRFATKGAEKFSGQEFTLSASGLPTLPDALCSVECDLRQTIPGGDHTILIGRVHDCVVRDGRPMIYYNRGFRRLVEA
ncbi:MAG: flavin reductase [Streptosporangiales bacterium]|nr:flavin reductase [Streptosporangiales bacterium]